MGLEGRSYEAFTMVNKELRKARETFPTPFHSAHEGFAVLYEEVDELWEVVRQKTATRDKEALVKEAIQVAAMAIRFIEDVGGVGAPLYSTRANECIDCGMDKALCECN